VSRYHLFHKIVQQLASSLLLFFCSRAHLAEASRLQSGMVAGILGSEREVEFTNRMSVSEAASGRPDEECRRTSASAESLSPLHTVEDILCPPGTIDTTHVVCYRQTVFLPTVQMLQPFFIPCSHWPWLAAILEPMEAHYITGLDRHHHCLPQRRHRPGLV
jgi:hypothetical protein